MAEPDLGTPLDPALLAEPVPDQRQFPWRPLTFLLVPAVALAAGTGLQRWIEGSLPAGDALLTWLCWSSGAGLVAGLAAGFLRARGGAGRLLWAAFGAASPWLVTALVLGAVRLARPVREAAAARRVATCSETRTLCTAPAFAAACAEAGRPLPAARTRAEPLGQPAQELCGPSGCTLRWVYQGPFGADDPSAPAGLICSVVTDPAGSALRFAVTPGSGPRD